MFGSASCTIRRACQVDLEGKRGLGTEAAALMVMQVAKKGLE